MPITIPVDFDTNAGDLERDLSKSASKAGTSTGKSFGGGLVSGFKRFAGPLAAVAATVGVKDLLADSLAEARESQKVGALTAQVIKQTGGAAKVTAEQVGDLATALSNKVGVDDEAIQTGANVLLGFKAIRNELGKGNAIFDRATKASADLASTPLFNGNITGASKQLGKALNDPLKGITLLGRAGITFTDGQKEQVKALVKTGDTLAAQRILIKAVEDRYKGAAEAQATSSDKARVAIDNLKEQIGTALLPVVDDLANKVAKDVVPAVSDFITGMQDGTGAGGEFVDTAKDIANVLGDVVDVGKDVLGFFNGLPGPVKQTAVELGIAYFALTKIKGILGPAGAALSGFTTSLRTNATDLDAVATKSRRFGVGLQTLVGAGGLVAVQQGLSQTNTGLSVLETTLGAAAAGFAVTAGNPIGGMIGGLLGFSAAAYKAATDTSGLTSVLAAQRAELIANTPVVESYASSLVGLSAAQTDATRDTAIKNLQANKKFFEGTGLGERVLLNAILGRKRALDTVTTTLTKQRTVLAGQRDAAQAQVDSAKQYLATQQALGPFNQKGREAAAAQVSAAEKTLTLAKQNLSARDALSSGQDKLIGGLRQQQNEQRHINALGLSYKDLLNMGIAPAVARAFDSKKGVGPYAADVANLIDKFKIVSETDWKPILQAAGLKPSREILDQVRSQLKDIERARRLKLTADRGALNTIAEINRAADHAARPRQFKIKATAELTLTAINNLFPGRVAGGPVRAGQPYIVGERRPEIFVPNQSGRIESRVPNASNVSRETLAPVSIVQNFYGPTTGRARLSELEWTIRYSTNARGYQGALSA